LLADKLLPQLSQRTSLFMAPSRCGLQSYLPGKGCDPCDSSLTVIPSLELIH